MQTVKVTLTQSQLENLKEMLNEWIAQLQNMNNMNPSTVLADKIADLESVEERIEDALKKLIL